MGEREHWNEIAARLRELPREDRWRSEDFGKLYRRATEDAAKLLNKWALGSLDPADLAAELLSTKLHSLVEAENPLPFFIKSLQNRAKSWLRSPRSQETEQPGDQAVEDRHAEAKLTLQTVLGQLSAVEREIFAADCEGEDRNALALRSKRSRAAIDQIISRARKRLQKAGYP